jgi:TolA-binding protein
MNEEKATMHAKTILRLTAVAAATALLFSCSSVQETTESTQQNDGFFDPSSTVAVSHPGLSVAEETGTLHLAAEESVSDRQLRAVIAEQNNKLRAVLEQLKSFRLNLGPKDAALDDLERTVAGKDANRSSTSEQEIIELLKEQNARLIDVLEQLKSVVARHDIGSQRAPDRMALDRSAKQSATLRKIDTKVAYGRAIQMYEEHRYGNAITAFRRILAKSKDEDLADNCKFWIGVSYFNLQKYEHAIPHFKHLLTHPWFEKKEAAFIMLGQCYEQLGEQSMAKSTYQKLVQLNPVCDLAYVAHLKISML